MVVMLVPGYLGPVANPSWRRMRRAGPRETRRGSLSAKKIAEMIEEATVDAYDESEQAVGWFTMFENHLALPFDTEMLGVRVVVEEIDLRDDNRIVVVCRRGRVRQAIDITELPLPTPRPPGWSGLRRTGTGVVPDGAWRFVVPSGPLIAKSAPSGAVAHQESRLVYLYDFGDDWAHEHQGRDRHLARPRDAAAFVPRRRSGMSAGGLWRCPRLREPSSRASRSSRRSTCRRGRSVTSGRSLHKREEAAYGGLQLSCAGRI